MKEAEIDALAMPWANARVAHLLSVHRMMTVEVGDGIMEEPNPDSYDQVMFTENMETIEPFSSHVVPVKAGRDYIENVSMSWYKPCGLKMALCQRASLYKTCTQN